MTVLAIVAVASFLILLMRSARPDEQGQASAAGPANPALNTSAIGPSVRVSVGQLVRRDSPGNPVVSRVVSVGSGAITAYAYITDTQARIGVPLGTFFEVVESGVPGGVKIGTIQPATFRVPSAVQNMITAERVKSEIGVILASASPAPRMINAAGIEVSYLPDFTAQRGFQIISNALFPALGERLLNPEQVNEMQSLRTQQQGVVESQYSQQEARAKFPELYT